MNISNELKEQAERFSRTRSFSLNAPLKKELNQWHISAGHGKINLGCATCLRNAMSKLLNSINDGEHHKPKIHFIGVKQ
jgi:hypothetical protein